MSVRAAWGIGIAAAAAACSLGDFSGYSTGGDDPASTDASTSDADANANANVDGGGSGDAASADGSALTDAGTFCQANADAGFFCEDFEGPNPLAHFESTQTLNGTLVVDNRSLVVDGPAGAGEIQVFGTVPAKQVGSSVRIAFNVVPETVDTTTGNGNQIAKLYFFKEGTPTYEVGVGIKGAGSSKLYAYEYTSAGAYTEFAELPPLAQTTMTRIVLEARIGDGVSGKRLNLYRDGVRVITDATLTPPANAGAIEAYLGLPFVSANHGAWKMRFDDIVVSLP